ncbi:hypothetical protein [Micromonospora sp. RP3T]|uniref:hypothetical protein n=1 Tax=Micromonospora sp. RP3T TaxID=2135446 RepID=UPI000D17354F|nr:hypothetical protein [Micromonospora sp. RP3T]PTA45279.1 hypothetical protein C8054_15815 [Micromonospora sp. RP3T]
MGERTDNESPGESFVSTQDVEDADDILFAHPPRRVVRWVCGCGEDYPCLEVVYARLVKAAATGPDEPR